MSTPNIFLLVDTLLALIDRGRVVSELIKKARAEGRDVSDAEIDTLSRETQEHIDAARAAATDPTV